MAFVCSLPHFDSFTETFEIQSIVLRFRDIIEMTSIRRQIDIFTGFYFRKNFSKNLGAQVRIFSRGRRYEMMARHFFLDDIPRAWDLQNNHG
jgi:hypothetical protein